MDKRSISSEGQETYRSNVITDGFNNLSEACCLRNGCEVAGYSMIFCGSNVRIRFRSERSLREHRVGHSATHSTLSPRYGQWLCYVSVPQCSAFVIRVALALTRLRHRQHRCFAFCNIDSHFSKISLSCTLTRALHRIEEEQELRTQELQVSS